MQTNFLIEKILNYLFWKHWINRNIIFNFNKKKLKVMILKYDINILNPNVLMIFIVKLLIIINQVLKDNLNILYNWIIIYYFIFFNTLLWFNVSCVLTRSLSRVTWYRTIFHKEHWFINFDAISLHSLTMIMHIKKSDWTLYFIRIMQN